jgi:pyruvate kinase
MSRVESIASTAVRVADKIQASLIIVYANSGRTASLVAKYRPQMPILTLVVPHLKSHVLGWDLQGRHLARQCLIMRGVIPMLAAPLLGSNDYMLQEAVDMAAKRGLVKPGGHIVAVMSMRENLVVKVVSMDGSGDGMHTRTGSHADLASMAAAAADGGGGGSRLGQRMLRKTNSVIAPEVRLTPADVPARFSQIT